MRHALATFTAVLSLAVPAALAQPPKIDAATLPDQVKKLDWKSVNWDSLSPLEQARVLMLLNHTLDELDAQLTAEADLMSEYIDQSDLGPKFAEGSYLDQSPVATMQDAQKVAAALLKGPMSSSSYATELAECDAHTLGAYQQMYTSTCARKWAGFVDSRQQVRAMSHFLKKSGNLDGFNAWAPGEVKRRADAHEAETARKEADAAQKRAEQKEQRQQAQQDAQQRKQAEQQQRQATAQVQQGLAASQQGAAPSGSDSAYPDWYYGGLGYVGTGAWYRDGAYRGAAANRTEARMSRWQGTRGRGGGGGGRR